jgi:hypothetical protein
LRDGVISPTPSPEPAFHLVPTLWSVWLAVPGAYLPASMAWHTVFTWDWTYSGN